MEDIVRVGVISTVNRGRGTVQVYYPDRGCTTEQMHLFAFKAEFSPLDIGDQVVVLHLSNDTSSGVVLGRFWGEGDLPPEDVDYYKLLGAGACERMEKGAYAIRAPEIRLEGESGSITLSELIELRRRVDAMERGRN